MYTLMPVFATDLLLGDGEPFLHELMTNKVIAAVTIKNLIGKCLWKGFGIQILISAKNI